MNIKKTKHYTEFQSSDSNGKFTVRVQSDLSQVAIETENELTTAYFNTDRKELTAIRDMLTKLLTK